MTDNPLLSAHRQIEDADAALRPKTLAEFVGQAAAKDNLRVFIESANVGEYKVYEVTSSNTAATDFTAATLVGSLDFGVATVLATADFV